MTIPTVADHVHTWERYEVVDDLGRYVRHRCAACADPRNRLELPGSLRNRALAAAKKRRRQYHAEQLKGRDDV